ncbi:MAG: hypothetical protein WAU50_05010, partial [Candidatus Sulfotelmatobacter sp.]
DHAVERHNCNQQVSKSFHTMYPVPRCLFVTCIYSEPNGRDDTCLILAGATDAPDEPAAIEIGA